MPRLRVCRDVCTCLGPCCPPFERFSSYSVAPVGRKAANGGAALRAACPRAKLFGADAHGDCVLWVAVSLLGFVLCGRAKMAWKRVFASLAFVLPLQAEALASHSFTSPQAFLNNAARPSSADRVSEYERKTQAPIVWLNLKKTELPAAVAAVSNLEFEANLVAEEQSSA